MTSFLIVSMLAVQGTQAPLQASSPHFTVDVLDRGSDESGARLMITRKDTTRYHIATLNRALGRARSIRLRDDDGRVIVITERGFAVVDPVGRTAQDEVWGFSVLASQDGRWIAYSRALRDEQNVDAGDGIVMYDTMQTPDANHAAFPLTAERSSGAGWPVYPSSGEWRKSSGLEPPRPPAVFSQWWKGSVYLADLRMSNSERLVLADVSQPGMRVCTKALAHGKERSSDAKDVTIRRQDGSYVVEIGSDAQSGRETVVFSADCGS